MEIGSLPSNAVSYVSGSQAQSARNTQAEENRQVEQQQSRAQESAENENAKPRPVANAQGQTTGTIVNVTA